MKGLTRIILWSLPLLACLTAHAEQDLVSYDLVVDDKGGNLEINLTLKTPEAIDGFALYEHATKRNPYENIPLKAFSLAAGTRKEFFLISFPTAALQSHPVSIKLHIAAPNDQELQDAKTLFSMISQADPNDEKTEMLKSEFALVTSPWTSSENGLSLLNRPHTPPRTTIGSPIVRSDDPQEPSRYAIKGSMALDKIGRGFAIIELPQGSE